MVLWRPGWGARSSRRPAGFRLPKGLCQSGHSPSARLPYPGLSRAALQLLDTAALQETLQELYAQLRGPAPVTGELHSNGTPRIPSLVAVWLMGRVSQAYKPGSKLVKLSRALDPEMLRSIGGVADLLIQAIRTDIEGSHA